MTTGQEVVKTAVESTPPITYAALHLFGVSMPDWVAILTAVYILVQTIHLLWRWHRAWNDPHLVPSSDG